VQLKMKDKVELGNSVTREVWTLYINSTSRAVSEVVDMSVWYQIRDVLWPVDGRVWNVLRDSIRETSKNES